MIQSLQSMARLRQATCMVQKERRESGKSKTDGHVRDRLDQQGMLC
jgi:hypothetical protein